MREDATLRQLAEEQNYYPLDGTGFAVSADARALGRLIQDGENLYESLGMALVVGRARLPDVEVVEALSLQEAILETPLVSGGLTVPVDKRGGNPQNRLPKRCRRLVVGGLLDMDEGEAGLRPVLQGRRSLLNACPKLPSDYWAVSDVQIAAVEPADLDEGRTGRAILAVGHGRVGLAPPDPAAVKGYDEELVIVAAKADKANRDVYGISLYEVKVVAEGTTSVASGVTTNTTSKVARLSLDTPQPLVRLYVQNSGGQARPTQQLDCPRDTNCRGFPSLVRLADLDADGKLDLLYAFEGVGWGVVSDVEELTNGVSSAPDEKMWWPCSDSKSTASKRWCATVPKTHSFPDVDLVRADSGHTGVLFAHGPMPGHAGLATEPGVPTVEQLNGEGKSVPPVCAPKGSFDEKDRREGCAKELFRSDALREEREEQIWNVDWMPNTTASYGPNLDEGLVRHAFDWKAGRLTAVVGEMRDDALVGFLGFSGRRRATAMVRQGTALPDSPVGARYGTIRPFRHSPGGPLRLGFGPRCKAGEPCDASVSDFARVVATGGEGVAGLGVEKTYRKRIAAEPGWERINLPASRHVYIVGVQKADESTLNDVPVSDWVPLPTERAVLVKRTSSPVDLVVTYRESTRRHYAVALERSVE